MTNEAHQDIYCNLLNMNVNYVSKIMSFQHSQNKKRRHFKRAPDI